MRVCEARPSHTNLTRAGDQNAKATKNIGHGLRKHSTEVSCMRPRFPYQLMYLHMG